MSFIALGRGYESIHLSNNVFEKRFSPEIAELLRKLTDASEEKRSLMKDISEKIGGIKC